MRISPQTIKKVRRQPSRPAFTIVEIIVVLLVVAVGLVGILSLITQNIQNQSYDKNSLIANHLAQEGVELVRRVRDSNWKANVAFNTNLAATIGQTYNYYMDYQDALPLAHTGGATELVLNQDGNGFYQDAAKGGNASIFSRLLTIKLLDADSLQVDAILTWSDHGHNFSYDLQTLLYDWH